MTLVHRYAPPDLLLGEHLHRFARDLPHLLLTGPGAAAAVVRVASMLAVHAPADVHVHSFADVDAQALLDEQCRLLERLVGEDDIFLTPRGFTSGVRMPFRAVEKARQRVDQLDREVGGVEWPRYVFLTVPELADLDASRRAAFDLVLTRGRIPGFFLVAGVEDELDDHRVAMNTTPVPALDVLGT